MRTAEAVRNGHPDKLCDLIADRIVDEYLKHDPYSRVAVEVQGGHGIVSITGEVTSKHDGLDLNFLINEVLQNIGVGEPVKKATWNVMRQSPEIANGVDRGGAGDSGIVAGYATNETAEMLPKELVLAKQICKAFDGDTRFGADGKAQVTLEDGQPKVIVVSMQHITPLYEAREIVEKRVREMIPGGYTLLINPAGSFISGGFDADTGATGRKIVQDQYGPEIPVGGGAFSGKDATKVDRSGAYWAREIAKEALNHGFDEALVKIAWAIGEPHPISATINGKDLRSFDFYSPLAVEEIIEMLDLRRPMYYEKTKNGLI